MAYRLETHKPLVLESGSPTATVIITMRSPSRYVLIFLLLLSSYSASAADTPPLPENARIARAQFTTEIVDREPVNRIVALDNTHREVFFFTDMRHLEGRTIRHLWVYNGEVMSEVVFAVNGPRWRVNSRMELDPSMTGKWTVWVVDETDWPLAASIFLYYPADKSSPKESKQ
jgi:hypothetical protein